MKKLLIPAALALALSPVLAHAQSAWQVNLPIGLGVITPPLLSSILNSLGPTKLDATAPGTTVAPLISGEIPPQYLGNAAGGGAVTSTTIVNALGFTPAASTNGTISSPNIISPVITGSASVPTAPAGDASNLPANTSWVAAAIAGLTGGVTGAPTTVSPTPFATTGSGTIASAQVLNYNDNYLTSCPANTAAVLPPSVPVTQVIWVKNETSGACTILPDSTSSQIESSGNGVAISLQAGAEIRFFKASATQWRD